MFQLDMLPRLVPDSYCDDWQEAFEEVSRRRAAPVAPDALIRMEASRYGGYRVYTVSMNLAMELFSDLAESGILPSLDQLLDEPAYWGRGIDASPIGTRGPD